MTTEQTLPKGWKTYNLFDICQPKQWKTIAVKDLKNEGYPVYGANGIIGYYHEYNHDIATVLLTCRGATCGEVHISKPYSYVNGNAMCMDNLSDNIITEFLYYYLKSINSNSIISGSAQPQITQIGLRKVEIPIPPLETQQAIVNKIESLFAEIDAGIGSLKTAVQQLAQYRQSLLKNAFNGELTQAWRKANADKLPTAGELLAQIQTTREQHHAKQLSDWQQAVSVWEQNGKAGKKPSKPKAPTQAVKFEEDFADLPNEWGEIRLGNLNLDIFDGPFGSNLKTKDYVDSGVRVIRLENIGYLKFITDKYAFITDEKYLTIQKHSIYSGDVVFSSFITDGIRVAIVPDNIGKAVNKSDCFCLRVLDNTILNKFLVYFLSTRSAYKQAELQIHGVGRPRINTTQLKNIKIPYCSLAEQTQIVAILENKLTACDRLAADLAARLKQAELLKQSVLKAAFSGKLLGK